MEQARQLYRQRLIEVQQRYPNSQGYQYHNQEPPPTRQLAEIMLRVYSKYPIPQLEHQGRGRAFFTYWQLHRRYSKAELESAELLRLVLNAHFEPTGSMCGTEYDESGECRYCGTGGRQVSNLILDTRRIPKGKDIARSIAGEFTSKPLRLTGATVTGNNPFDLDENDEYRCPRGHTAGLRQISELHVQRKSWHGADWCHTEKLFGLRRGELRPEPRVLISQKLRQLLVGMKAKGVEFEVAHVEGPRLTVL